MNNVLSLLNWRLEAAGYFEIDTDAARFRLYFMTDDIVRVRCSFDEQFKPELSYALVLTAWADLADDLLAGERRRITPLSVNVSETEQTVTLVGKKLVVVINKKPFGINICDCAGNLLHSDMKQRAYVRDQLGRVSHCVTRGDNDGYYGYGEKSGELNKLHRRMKMNNVDTYDYDAEKTDPLYKHIPFYIRLDKKAGHAHGIFYNNSYISVFDVGAEHSNYWGKQTLFTADGGELDWFFINGPKIPDVIEGYTDLTGKTALPPVYSLGFLGSTMYYTEIDSGSDTAILNFFKRCELENIPCDGFHMSSGYTTGTDNKRYVFNWNNRRIAQPAEFIADSLALGGEIVPNIKPGMLLSHPLYQEFSNAGAYIKNANKTGNCVDRYWGGSAAFVDFTNPVGRDTWQKHLVENYINYGITAIWNDNCEYEINDAESMCCAEETNEKIASLRPLQPTLMALVAQRTVRATCPDKRPFVLNRAGYAGIQRYASTWSGDNGTSWHNLKFGVPIMLGMSLSGVAFQGADIGGFAGAAPTAELFVRWVQHGVLQPRFCIHSCNNDNTVTEPWMYPKYTKYIRAAIKFRYRLIPYLYSLMYQAAIKGHAVARPLLYDFQQDIEAVDNSFDYMIGPYILAACVLEEGATERTLYLPSGFEWLEWETLRRYQGGQHITVNAPLEKTPLFIRSGAIIPLTDGINCLNKQAITDLEIIIEPSIAAKFSLYEDDGKSNAWEQGEKLITEISTAIDGFKLDIDFQRQGNYITTVKTIKLHIICPERAPLYIAINGQSLQMFIDDKSFADANSGFWFNPENRCSLVKFDNVAGAFRVTIRFDAKDLISID
ncbi:MAG: TIM-barrel domain-containing protein [Negativicutes bacterium]|jgi:alpha-glucosidase